MKIAKQDTDFTNPHRGRPAGFFSSLLRMTYYWLDYLLGVPVMVRRHAKFDRFLIFDRYIYDFVVDPLRSSIKLPRWLRMLFVKLTPEPNLVLILLTDADTIYRRKAELTVDEIKRQLGEYQRLAKDKSRFVVLDASQNPEAITRDAVKIILEKISISSNV